MGKEELERLAQHLIKVNTVVKEKGVTARYVYHLVEKGQMEGIKIDGVQFVINNEKYKKWEKK